MVGHILRQEREKQNLTVKDVERETSIRALYISSIEDGKYDVLPGEVYLKGFIKTYANYLGLDGAETLKLYYEEKNDVTPSSAPSPISPVTDRPLGKADAGQLTAEPEQETDKGFLLTEKQKEEGSIREKVKSAQKEREGNLKKYLALGAAIVVVAGLGYWGFGTDDNKQTLPPASTAKQTTMDTTKSQNTAPPVDQKQIKGVEITAKYTGRSWTEVVADNKTIYEGTPGAGESFTWKADKTISIRSGNAGAVEVTHNGKSIGKLGDSGEVVAKNFTQDKVTNTK